MTGYWVVPSRALAPVPGRWPTYRLVDEERGGKERAKRNDSLRGAEVHHCGNSTVAALADSSRSMTSRGVIASRKAGTPEVSWRNPGEPPSRRLPLRLLTPLRSSPRALIFAVTLRQPALAKGECFAPVLEGGPCSGRNAICASPNTRPESRFAHIPMGFYGGQFHLHHISPVFRLDIISDIAYVNKRYRLGASFDRESDIGHNAPHGQAKHGSEGDACSPS